MARCIKKIVCANSLKIIMIFVLSLFFSCDENRKARLEVKEEAAYYLEKVDSIVIDRENTVRVLDFNPVNHRFLAFDQITQEFLVLNNKGHLLESVLLVGEGPNEYNSKLIAASFNKENGGYFALSSTEFLWFNEDWEVKKRIRFASHATIIFYNGPKLNVPYFRLLEGETPYFFTSFFSGINTFTGGETDEMLSNYLIELYDPQKESLDWVLPNDPQMLPDFELETKSGQNRPVQVLVLDRESKLLYLTFETSDEIGIYDMANNFKLVKKLHFQHRNFALSQKSKNIALYNFSSDLIGVLYFEGLSDAAAEVRKANDPDYFPFFDPSLYRLILVHDGLQQEQEIEFPLWCEPRSELVFLPGRRILLRDRYKGDDEPEYSTYSVFELKFG
jgi:hypothetical protein